MDSKRLGCLSDLAIGVGALTLLVLGLLEGYWAFYRWLDHQNRYLVSQRIATFDVPAITPSPTPTITPTPTAEPEPLPAVRIIIPKIGLNEKIVEIGLKLVGSGENARFVWDSAAYAVGHRETSAHPGQGGNIVLSGHNNTLGEVFRRLDQLEPGDLIYLYTPDKEFVYEVQEKDLVPVVGATESDVAKHERYAGQTSDETLTLVSCWPYVTYTHRIYIIARPQK